MHRGSARDRAGNDRLERVAGGIIHQIDARPRFEGAGNTAAQPAIGQKMGSVRSQQRIAHVRQTIANLFHRQMVG